MTRRALLTLFLLALSAVARAACPAPEGGVQLAVKDFAKAHFLDFTVSGSRNSAEFRGLVCLDAADGSWQLRADTVRVSGLQEGGELNLEADAAELEAGPWEFRAARLEGDGEDVVLHEAMFSGAGISGTAGELLVNLETGTATATLFSAEGPGYRLSGSAALLSGEGLHVSAAHITTCTCPGEPFYTVSASRADVDLGGDAALTLQEGALNFRGMTIPLKEEVQLRKSSLADLKPPVSAEWNPAPPGRAPRGYGFSVLVPAFSPAPGVKAEFGVTGLDRAHPLSGFFLFSAEGEAGSLLAGYTRGGGPRADVDVRRQLHEHLRLVLGFHNRHYASEDFLHEGFIRLETSFPAWKGDGGARFDWSASLTAAVSSQLQSGVAVMSPRLRSALSADWRLPESRAGRFRLRLDSELSVYSQGREQYGLRLRSDWTDTLGPFTVTAAHDRHFTDSGSPFSERLDRLKPRSVTTATLALSDQQLGDTRLDLRAAAAWNWLHPDDAGFTDLQATASLEGRAGNWTVRPHLKIQLAGIVLPHGTEKTDAFLEGGLTLAEGDLELGFRGRHGLRENGRPELLELSAAWPLTGGNVRFVPFLAFDFVPLLLHGEPPAVSGHGLQVDWDSCCGLFRFGYRVANGELTTSFSAEFIGRD